MFAGAPCGPSRALQIDPPMVPGPLIGLRLGARGAIPAVLSRVVVKDGRIVYHHRVPVVKIFRRVPDSEQGPYGLKTLLRTAESAAY